MCPRRFPARLVHRLANDALRNMTGVWRYAGPTVAAGFRKCVRRGQRATLPPGLAKAWIRDANQAPPVAKEVQEPPLVRYARPMEKDGRSNLVRACKFATPRAGHAWIRFAPPENLVVKKVRRIPIARRAHPIDSRSSTHHAQAITSVFPQPLVPHAWHACAHRATGNAATITFKSSFAIPAGRR
jgi:hypothetical protein